MQHITMDGKTYRVRIVYPSLKRAFSIKEGQNSGTAINGRKIRDIIGTEYAYSVDIEPDPMYPQDYDNFYDMVSAPVDYVHIAFPYGQEIMEFDAEILSGTDTFAGKIGGFNRWTGLSLTFAPIRPQRREIYGE